MIRLEYGANTAILFLPQAEIHFSYRTPIAFFVPGQGSVLRQNDWGLTTGKHLNALDGGDSEARAKRLPSAEFEAALEKALGGAL